MENTKKFPTWLNTETRWKSSSCVINIFKFFKYLFCLNLAKPPLFYGFRSWNALYLVCSFQIMVISLWHRLSLRWSSHLNTFRYFFCLSPLSPSKYSVFQPLFVAGKCWSYLLLLLTGYCNKHSQTIGQRGRGKFYYTETTMIFLHPPPPPTTICIFYSTINCNFSAIQDKKDSSPSELTKELSVLHENLKSFFSPPIIALER